MADLPRFFIPAEAFASDPIVIVGEPLHHLRSVLRLTPGCQVLLLDGMGGCCRARLVTVGRDQATASVMGRWHITESPCPLRLLQALPKGDRFDLVLQKGTELGVGTFQPLVSARTQARADTSRRARWLRIISEAARQSRRPRLPELESLCPLGEAVKKVTEPVRLVLWEESARPLREVLPAAAPAGIALLVGPEGGLATAEITDVVAAGFIPVHLGPRIVRTETAGLAMAAIIQFLYGDWQNPPQHDRADNLSIR